FRLGQVERQAALVAVAGQVIGARRLARDTQEGRPPAARFIALARPLHLEDLGAQVTKDLSAKWPSQYTRCVQHANAGQQAAHCREHEAPPVISEPAVRARTATSPRSRCGLR